MTKDVLKESLEKGYRSFFVKTNDGSRGKTYYNDKLEDGKIPVYLIDGRFNPLKNSAGENVVIYCPPNSLKIIGYTH